MLYNYFFVIHLKFVIIIRAHIRNFILVLKYLFRFLIRIIHNGNDKKINLMKNMFIYIEHALKAYFLYLFFRYVTIEERKP